jgi:hypothetical protein
MKNLPVRSALAFSIPVLLVFGFSAFNPQNYYFLAAGPLSGIVGALALRRTWGLPIVLGSCFGMIGLLFALEDGHSALFSDVIWTGLVSGFLFWIAGGSAMLTLPTAMRFNGAAALAIPGTLAGMVFQFAYGPAHFLLNVDSHQWWAESRWEHLLLWLIAAAGGGWLLGLNWQRQAGSEETRKFSRDNPWAATSIVCGALGLGIGALYFTRSTLPLGLFNSLSPASAAADWLWGWGVLAATVALVALFKPNRRPWTALGIGLALTLVLVSYRIDANPWKLRFNSNYAEKLLHKHSSSGDAIYAGNLILAQAALDKNDVDGAKHYLLEAATTPGTRRIEQNGLDVSVARVLFDRGEKDTVLEYLHRGRTLWPQGAQIIGRWETAIRAGRRPNFNARGPGAQGNPQDR